MIYQEHIISRSVTLPSARLPEALIMLLLVTMHSMLLQGRGQLPSGLMRSKMVRKEIRRSDRFRPECRPEQYRSLEYFHWRQKCDWYRKWSSQYNGRIQFCPFFNQWE